MARNWQNQWARLSQNWRRQKPVPGHIVHVGTLRHLAPNHNLGPYMYLLIRILFGTDMICIFYLSKKQANSSLCSLQNNKVPQRYINPFPQRYINIYSLGHQGHSKVSDLIYIFPKEVSATSNT